MLINTYDDFAMIQLKFTKTSTLKGHMVLPGQTIIITGPVPEKPTGVKFTIAIRNGNDAVTDRFDGDVSVAFLLNRTDLEVEGLTSSSDIFDEYAEEDVVPTIVGEYVEPDGRDRFGHHSILVALGLL